MTLNTPEQMNTLLNKISRASQSLRSRVQEYMIQAAGHAYQHGDVSYFTKLVKAANGADTKKITAWAAEYGYAQINVKERSAKLIRSARKAADFEDGAAVVEYHTVHAENWWEMGVAKKAPAVLDVNKRVQSLVKQLNEAFESENPALVDLDQLTEDFVALRRASEAMAAMVRELEASAEEEAAEAETNIVAIAAE